MLFKKYNFMFGSLNIRLIVKLNSLKMCAYMLDEIIEGVCKEQLLYCLAFII